MGLSPQRPLYRAYQRDPERVDEWKKVIYPKIRTLAAEEGASIFFEDEAGLRTDHHAGTTWSPVGQTPVVIKTGERKSISMVSAISPRGELRFRVQEGGMNADRFIDFLKALLSTVEGKVFLIVDGHPVHKSKKVRDFAESETGGRLKIFFLHVHSRGSGNWRQLTAGSGGSQGFPVRASRMASSAVTPWAAAESR
jgi:hypothetical protein